MLTPCGVPHVTTEQASGFGRNETAVDYAIGFPSHLGIPPSSFAEIMLLLICQAVVPPPAAPKLSLMSLHLYHAPRSTGSFERSPVGFRPFGPCPMLHALLPVLPALHACTFSIEFDLGQCRSYHSHFHLASYFLMLKCCPQ